MQELKVKEHTEINKTDYSDFLLAGDIGGTNTNLAVFGIKDEEPVTLLTADWKSNNLQGLEAAINPLVTYSKEKHNIEITKACLGVAGPVNSKRIHCVLTYVDWDIDKKKLLAETPLEQILLINDFEALGYALNGLDISNPEQIEVIRSIKHIGQFTHNTRKALIGPGTGLGKSILDYHVHLGAHKPVASEGHFAEFPGTTLQDIALIEFIKEQEEIQSVNCGLILSGRGITHIYNFLSHQRKYPETQASQEIITAKDKSAAISEHKFNDPLCRDTFALLAKYYGRIARNLALTALSHGGLYFAGGVTQKNPELLKHEEFWKEFEKDDRINKILENMPMYLIKKYDISLLGAAYAAMLELNS